MSGRKYMSGSMKRKRKAEKLKLLEENVAKKSILDNFLVQVQTDDDDGKNEKDLSTVVGVTLETSNDIETRKNTSEIFLNITDESKIENISNNDCQQFNEADHSIQVAGNSNLIDAAISSSEVFSCDNISNNDKDINESNHLIPIADNSNLIHEDKSASEITISSDNISNNNSKQFDEADNLIQIAGNSNPIHAASEVAISYDNDPALWPKITQRLRDYFARNKPDQNMKFLKNSGRIFGSKMRRCNESNFFREKKNGEVVERNWLIYSKSTNALFCYVCKLYSNSKDALCTSGLTDWQNLTKRLSSHETSKSHQQAVNCLSQLLCTSKRVDSIFIKENESERMYWKNVLKRVFEVIKFISQRGLSFFGNNETFGSNQNGNFLGILELVSKFDPFLNEHIQSHGNKGQGHVNYLSSSIVDELIKLMSNRVLKQIIAQVQEAKYYGIIVDSTPDVTHIDHMCIVLRYVDSKNEPVERFLTFVSIHSHAAKHLYETITALFKEYSIDLKYCRGQSYDNASNMAGKYSGLQKRLKLNCPLAEFVPCSGHSLNLVGVSAVESCQSAVSYFGFVQTLYTFFSGSSHRWEALTCKLKEASSFTLKSLSCTRWSANADAVRALRKGYNIVSNILSEMCESENENAATKYEAKCLYKKICAFENVLLTIIWDTLLQRINSTSKSLQSYACSIEAIVPLYESLENFVCNVRASFDVLEEEASVLFGGISYTKSRSRRIPKALDDSMSADVISDLSERDKFIFQTHYVICDTLMFNLNKRKKEYQALQSRFGFLSNRNDLPKTQLCEAAKKFQEVYCDDIEEEFIEEFLQFAEFMPSITNATEMLQIIKSLHIEHTYPNVEVALRIFLSIPVSNCSGERSFSAMKRVKTRLRACMSDEKLSGLALLTIENDLTNDLLFEDILNDFLSSKHRKKLM